MRNNRIPEKSPTKHTNLYKCYKNITDLTRQVWDSTRNSGELMENSRDSENSDHPFWRTQGGTQGASPLGFKARAVRTSIIGHGPNLAQNSESVGRLLLLLLLTPGEICAIFVMLFFCSGLFSRFFISHLWTL